MTRVAATRTLENTYRRLGFVHVAGVDEVGRGCLAGPVVTAAVVLDPTQRIAGLADSKQVPAADREETLKKAEKLLRQGRLDAAIVEYQRVADDYPRDWNTANALGDCYYRAHEIDKAVE